MNSQQAESVQEDIEGLGEPGDADWGTYPIDTVLVRTENRTIYDVIRRIERGGFVMHPDFQRDFVWAEDKQSKLIESVLMRIPLPVFYLAENRAGEVVVVDGLQRLSTFQKFLGDGLSLRLPKQAELDRKKFKDLPSKLQNRIEDFNLVFYILDAKVAPQARLDMFERVNSGEHLSRQQMRNCLYNGEATEFLKEEARTEVFRRATGHSLDDHKQMRDREFVNRFCAFHLISLDEYKGDMDDFLAKALIKMNGFTSEEMEGLRKKFQVCLRNNVTVFEEGGFRKRRSGWRSVLNASIWDVMTTGLADYSESSVKHNAEALKTAFFNLLGDPDFEAAITHSTNVSGKVRRRFAMAEKMFSEVLGAHQD